MVIKIYFIICDNNIHQQTDTVDLHARTQHFNNVNIYRQMLPARSISCDISRQYQLAN